MEGRISTAGPINLHNYREAINQAFVAAHVDEVIISVNSFGGSLVQADLISSLIQQKSESEGIPVTCFVEDEAASCGYWIACSAPHIYACRSSVIGGIGLISKHPWIKDWRHFLLSEKKKVEDPVGQDDCIVSVPHKTSGHPDVALKEGDLAIIEENIAIDHSTFVNTVQASRGSRLSGTDLFTGRVWMGSTALDLGLIDGIDQVESYIYRKWGDDVTVYRWRLSPASGE